MYVHCICTDWLAAPFILFYSNKITCLNIKFHQALPICANLDTSPSSLFMNWLVCLPFLHQSG